MRLAGIRSADGACYVAELADGGARPIAGRGEFGPVSTPIVGNDARRPS